MDFELLLEKDSLTAPTAGTLAMIQCLRNKLAFTIQKNMNFKTPAIQILYTTPS